MTYTTTQQTTINRIADQYRRVRKVHETSQDARIVCNTKHVMDRLMAEAVTAGVRDEVAAYLAARPL